MMHELPEAVQDNMLTGMKPWRTLTPEAHQMAFNALIENCASITQNRMGMPLIESLQDTTNLIRQQIEDTTMSGFPEIPDAYTRKINWFERILEHSLEAKGMYEQALATKSPEERQKIAGKITILGKKVAGIIELVNQAGNKKCGAKCQEHIMWFKKLMQAAMKGEPIVQPDPI